MLKPDVSKETGSLSPKIIGHSDESDALVYCIKFWSADSEYFKKKLRSYSYKRMGAAMMNHATAFPTGRKTGKITVPEPEAFESRQVVEGMNPRTARWVFSPSTRFARKYGIEIC